MEVAEATKKLLASVAENMGVEGLEWKIASIQFKCDGCGLLRPDRPGPEEGWTFRDGDDLCPACTAKEHTAADGGSSANRAEAVAEATPDSGGVSAVGGEGT